MRSIKLPYEMSLNGDEKHWHNRAEIDIFIAIEQQEPLPNQVTYNNILESCIFGILSGRLKRENGTWMQYAMNYSQI